MDHKNTAHFDVVRGVAAIFVLAAHVAQAFLWRHYGAGSWADLASGWAARFAVLAFFLLSGRLIVASIVSNVRRNGSFDPIDYFLNRIARLYPPLLFAIALSAAVVATIHLCGLPGSQGSSLGTLRPSGISLRLTDLVQSLLIYNGLTIANGPLWTLYIEVKLYIAASGGAMLTFGRNLPARMIGCALVLFAVSTGIDHHRFCFFAVIWCLGAFTNLPGARKPGIFLAASTAAVALCYMTPGYSDYIDGSFGTLAQSIGCAAIAYGLLVWNGEGCDFPRWLLKTGDFSYTFYVTHFPILALALSISLAISDKSFVVAGLAAFLASAAALGLSACAASRLEDTPKIKRALVTALDHKLNLIDSARYCGRQ
ncbi:acyltransferase [Bradyrhizobium sp. CB2312]|uniref:acyltransferase family protein n=1 Tax=Bradyrhizobium sp. CB2312 TaxID=3039155 RepID=UPI0024B03FD0|nr:acyltransferase [Bradyrhizobium sp. CB2312]WFU75665.1 acyltransferase [Bradyrhizobium sp. CB2312]